jgi:hypothetical protein
LEEERIRRDSRTENPKTKPKERIQRAQREDSSERLLETTRSELTREDRRTWKT